MRATINPGCAQRHVRIELSLSLGLISSLHPGLCPVPEDVVRRAT